MAGLGVWEHGPVRRIRPGTRPTTACVAGIGLLPGLFTVSAVTAAAYLGHALMAPLSVLTAALLVGLLVGNLLPLPIATGPGISCAAVRVLRVGVALLGAEVSAQAFLALGSSLLLGVVFTVAATILGVVLLARLLRVDPELGLLVGVGYGICGASAVAAARSQTRATDEQASYAVALVALCGTLSIGVLPLLGAAAGLGDVVFGHWVGAAVHDVGQVVAAASTRSPEALEAAIVVKLARVALLAPVVLLLSLRSQRSRPATPGRRPALLPAFVLAFLALAALRSTGLMPPAVVDATGLVAKLAMAMGLAALGLQVRIAHLRRLGGRPLVLGLLAWVLVAGVSLVMVRLLG